MVGVYEIRNVKNNNRYVGSSVNIQKRWNAHIRDLRANRHHSPYLQRAWNKYGEGCFQFTVLEECEENELLSKEQVYIDSGVSAYNLCKIAGNTRGRLHTETAKKKMSDYRKGRVLNVGYKHTPEARKNMSEARKLQYKLNPVSDATRKIISKIHKGKKLTEEHKRKLSLAHIGTKASPETRAKMSKSHTGKSATPETRLKLSQAKKGNTNNLGKVFSEEWRRKISEAKKLSWANKRLEKLKDENLP